MRVGRRNNQKEPKALISINFNKWQKKERRGRLKKVLPASPVLHALIAFIGFACSHGDQQEPMSTNNGSDINEPSRAISQIHF